MVDAERRRALEQRRRELQQKLRLEPENRGVRRTLNYLAAHGIPYTLERDPQERPAHWIAARFPHVGYTTIKLDWSRHPGAVRGPEMDAAEAEVVGWFDALQAAGRTGDCDVVLITDNGADPMIRLRFADLRVHPGMLAIDGWAWWILCEGGRWLIQYGDGQPWWWGRAAHVD